MSGHSKWASIKHKKAAVDAKRGQIFTKLVKEISVAAREGGGDPAMNARLRTAVQAAKDSNMPLDNIERAIKKGTGELPGVTYSEITYEGYGPGGVAIIFDVMTDNKNRTASEIRKVFSKRNGALGETGCVGWMFAKKGVITVPKEAVEEDKLMDLALNAGAEDMKLDGEIYEIVTAIPDFENVKKVLKESEINWEDAELNYVPSNLIKITEEPIAKQVLALMEELEDHDDVQKVAANFDIDEELMG
ncbi:YebC/PmpR family DNA-binding transcriptional regulator [bacterium]|nr:YebC/PmpR family DNA-binding transcriptional regulator [bacterium]